MVAIFMLIVDTKTSNALKIAESISFAQDATSHGWWSKEHLNLHISR